MLFHRRCYMSPLLLALIFITLCHNVFSRHPIRHYKDRFKRQQGADLYLPGSYVTDGGDTPDRPDAGPWMDWSVPSSCSRTCGGGVSTQERQCTPGYTCEGPTMRHFSCNTQDCPDNEDFRSQQCAKYNSKPDDKNILYEWIPYTKGENPCTLDCMPRGERFYYRYENAVVDGTRCNDVDFDVCVKGKCQSVGCDMMLGSSTKEDRCRICGGDGSSCSTVSGLLDMQDLANDYNDILLIPAGATNIKVNDVKPSLNYLAIRNGSHHYYLNGDYQISFPRNLDIAGCRFHYEREMTGLKGSVETITCLGPTDEALFIVLLRLDQNLGIEYEYSVPTNIQPGSEKEDYAWIFDEFGQCSVSCGGGVQHRNVTCAGRKSLNAVDTNLCDSNLKPETSRRCGEVPCDAQWVPRPWGNCSEPCGDKGGIQTREVFCQQVISGGQPSLVSDEECASQPKPTQQQTCNKGNICAKWHIGPWKPCDHLCGDGKQTRKVKCFIQNENHTINVLPDKDCESIEPKPTGEKKCNLRPCEGVDWVTSEWSGCDKICGLTNETRKVQCATASGEIFADDLCELDQKPNVVRPCNATNVTCEYLWYASQWSECSVDCGSGVQTRTVFCGANTPDGVQEVDKAKCDESKHFEVIKSCNGTKENCEGEWFSGPWGECSKMCGGGERTKKVICLQNNKVVDVSYCNADKIVFSQETCNTQACSPDTILPTDVTQHIDESEGTTTPKTTGTADEELITSIEETEPTSIPSSLTQTDKPEEDDDEYEIVPDDECEDGEWVDEDDEFVDVTRAQEDDNLLGRSTVSESDLEISTEPSLSSDDLMLSDGTPSTILGSESASISTSMFSEVTGSGDDEDKSTASRTKTDATSASPSSEIEEGSGDTTLPSLISTENLEGLKNAGDDLIPIYSDSTGDTDLPTDVSGSTDTTGGTNTGLSNSEVSELTTVGVSGGSTEIGSDITTDIPDSTTISSSDTTESQSSSESSATETTDVTTTTDDTTSSSTDSTLDMSSESTTIDLTETTSNAETTTEIDMSGETTTEVSGGTTSSSSLSESAGTTDSLTGSTELGVSDLTTESGETTMLFTGSTETSKPTESTLEFTGTTEVGKSEETTLDISGETTAVSGASSEVSETSASTVAYSGSTKITTEFTGTTESSGTTEMGTTISGSSTEFDIWSSTTEAGVSGSSTSSDLWETTPITDLFQTMKPRMCKRRKLKSCKKAKYGCCWDNITPAKGPFDKGCPTPTTCKESVYGCCEDGVSPALGPKFKGCPSTHCNETLFGCCSDGKTPSDGNNNEGCPPPPPACLKSRYGCCKDNSTAAKGPKQKGCEPEPTTEPPSTKGQCSNSTYGCCPDGIKEAQGPNFKGCDIIKENCKESYYGCCPDQKTSATGPNNLGCITPCSNTSFGCCPDGVTPAHGYSREGCCLETPYGCCPDNIQAANGPQLEGCGCQYAPYGCCPDNKTAALGYNKEGCGCQYTDYGCCPDSYTQASGPDYQGCLCHTFQFGCCPDGVTSAKGPHQQGCDCRQSTHGCCSDEKTPAQGPNGAGCGCDTTKYGCCPDGVTEAKGDNFDGCQDVPANLQESCSLQKERGSCRNYTVKWFFDMDYGGCSRFWYGGCDGNNNRFKSKDECDSICVRPEGSDMCNLPKVPGPCKGYYPQWYYDKDAQHCTQFIYGGCLGNNNRFETREECMKLCVKDNRIATCEQPKEEGPCRGQYRRYYFDKESSQCREFVFGGCKGNNNNFATVEACQQQCLTPGKPRDYCSLPKTQGNCTAKEARWYSDDAEKRCAPFYYTGCNGNSNNFNSKDACEADCPPAIEKDTCYLPAETGECDQYVDRWYFDTKEKACRQFYYGGCGGNGNNFISQQACEGRCVQQQRQPEPVVVPPQQPFRREFCFLPSDTGSCRAGTVRYYYDRSDGVCKSFMYGGCEGNGNNFASIEECVQSCGNVQDLCTLPAVEGPCNSPQTNFYYDQGTDSCREFRFSGCGGNYNRFTDLTSCEQRCKKSRDVVTTQAPVNQPYNEFAMCYEPADGGNCTDSYSFYFFNASSAQCTPFTYTGCGGNANRFNSEEQCERQCGAFRGQDVCNLEPDPGPCKAYFNKFYYDRSAQQCREFAFGGCGGNGNRFSSSEECQSICLTHQENRPNISSTVICQLPADIGAACQDGSYKRWYFDNARGQCTSFIYTGCGGNYNNFKSFQSCVDYCGYLITPPEPYQPQQPNQPHPCEDAFNKCSTLQCAYGIEAYVDENQCNTCQCHDPCRQVTCGAGSRCGIDLNMNRTSEQETSYIATCRDENKKGTCPRLEVSTNCEIECDNDADCSQQRKCCSTGCGKTCVDPVAPAELITQSPYQPAYTESPIEASYRAPEIDPVEYQPEVQGLIGDHVILNCAVRGNPNPKIHWSKDNLQIDGTQPRYRVRLDQTLQILTLHTTDSGIYLCTATNNIGTPITNQIKLNVTESPPRPAAVFEPDDVEPNAIVSLNAPATLNCYALGYPIPYVTWWKDDTMIPLKNDEFEVRKDYSLLIHSVQLHNLGIYTCQAYNGIGKAASWSVTVKAKGPYYSNDPDDQKYMQYIVSPPEEPIHIITARPEYPYRPQPQQDPLSVIPNEILPEEPPPDVNVAQPGSYIVPVETNITVSNPKFPVNGTLSLPCNVIGFPLPQVQWYKDGVPIYASNDGRIQISESYRLTISRAETSDSGMYMCEAANAYSKSSSSVNIMVEGMYISPLCTDNRHLANCHLIVKAQFCSHKYYAKFCCRSCTEAGLLPAEGPHIDNSKQEALQNNLV